MNIITTTYISNLFYIRPDISLNRDSNDYFCPDGIEEITVTPFIYVKMDKAGKAVQAKFASRYYSSIGYGVNITAPSLIDNRYPQSFLMANSLDNSTIVSALSKIEDFQFDHNLKGSPINCNNAEWIENLSKDDLITLINNKIEAISKFTSFKTGDYIAIEIAQCTRATIGERVIWKELAFTIK